MAVFENHRALGPIIKVIPIGIGKGACIAVLTDPNYEVRISFYCINNHRISVFFCSTKSTKKASKFAIFYIYESPKLLFRFFIWCDFIFPLMNAGH